MKKYFYMAAMALIALTATLSLTACGDDDDDDDYARTFASADFTIYNNFSGDIFDFYDVTWTVTDWDGNTTTFKAANGEKQYNYKTTKTEGTAKVTYTCTLKSGLTPDNAEHTLCVAPYFGFQVLDQYGSPMEETTYFGLYGGTISKTSAFDGEGFLTACDNLFSKTVTYELTLKNNHITQTIK